MDTTTDAALADLRDQAILVSQEIEATSLCSKRIKELLPNSVEIIGLLNSGTFISSSGYIKLHKELSRHSTAYGILLELSGNTLVHHPAGFFHIQAREGQGINLRERQIAGSIFCLIEWLSDRGLPVESMINSESPVNLADITALVDHHKERLSEIGLGSQEEFIANGLKKLCEAGVMHTQTDSKGDTVYCLGIPTYFYLDVARKMAKSMQEADDDDGKQEVVVESAGSLFSEQI